MGQVLQIGRLGESEALFALFVSASLLLWHVGYTRGWPPLAVWCAGFGFAALAALVKGPQAPVYFVAITTVYLFVRRDWRYMARWQFAFGACLFVAIIAAWQVPFYLATDWQSVVATWSGLAADRIHLGGLAKHMVSYPIETFSCLLPWSPLLVALAKRDTRALLADSRDVTTFLVTALLVAYPTVWMAAGARGRYFMPLYPVVAILVGMLIERSAAAAAGTYPYRAWRQFLLLTSTMVAGAGLIVGISSLLPGDAAGWLHQPRWFDVLFGGVAAAAAFALWTCYRASNRVTPIAAVATVAAFVCIAFVGLMVNVNAARWNDPTVAIAELRSKLPANSPLVSLSPIEHRFAYFYETPIAELDWPLDVDDLPADVDYFCFMRHAGDTAESRAAGRGRSWTTTRGTLPFAWEELASICVERKVKPDAPRVVLARVIRPLRAEVTDATVPRTETAQRRDSNDRR
jgi:4-amino-4-deoxy-L-arabinose transferase-like glycosyltransferase